MWRKQEVWKHMKVKGECPKEHKELKGEIYFITRENINNFIGIGRIGKRPQKHKAELRNNNGREDRIKSSVGH